MLQQGFAATTVGPDLRGGEADQGQLLSPFRQQGGDWRAAVDFFAAFGTELYSAA